jgi:hypothetical protein
VENQGNILRLAEAMSVGEIFLGVTVIANIIHLYLTKIFIGVCH